MSFMNLNAPKEENERKNLVFCNKDGNEGIAATRERNIVMRGLSKRS